MVADIFWYRLNPRIRQHFFGEWNAESSPHMPEQFG
jgi:hypothetical protein